MKFKHSSDHIISVMAAARASGLIPTSVKSKTDVNCSLLSYKFKMLDNYSNSSLLV